MITKLEFREDKPAVLYYKKLPKNINQSFVLLVDPMLATAGSAIRAIQVLKVRIRPVNSWFRLSRVLFIPLFTECTVHNTPVIFFVNITVFSIHVFEIKSFFTGIA